MPPAVSLRELVAVDGADGADAAGADPALVDLVELQPTMATMSAASPARDASSSTNGLGRLRPHWIISSSLAPVAVWSRSAPDCPLGPPAPWGKGREICSYGHKTKLDTSLWE